MNFNISGFSPQDKNYIKNLGIDSAADGKAEDISLADFKKAKVKNGAKFKEAVGKLFVKLKEKDPAATDAFLEALKSDNAGDEVAWEVAEDAEKGFVNKDIEAAGIKTDNEEIKNIVADLFAAQISEDGYNKLKSFLDKNPNIKTSFNKVAAEYADMVFALISSEGGNVPEVGVEEVLDNAEKIGKEKDRLIKEDNALDALVLMITAKDYTPEGSLIQVKSFKTKLEKIMAGK